MSFILHRNSENGLTEPRFQCDYCHKIIEDAGGALLLWNDDYKQKVKNVVPKVSCRKCDYNGAQGLPMSMELDTALIFLLNNCGMTPQRIKEQSRIAATLGSL
jgi:hypothetical protein